MSMSQYKVRGLVAAVFTPMHDNGDINVAVVPNYAKFLLENNIKGIFVNGTTGEFASLTIQERDDLVEAWSKKSKHGLEHLMIHVGAPSIKDAQHMAKHAETHKADAIGLISPSFFKPTTLEVLVEYCRQVAACAPSTPFYYYHLPQMTAVQFDMVEYIKLAEKSIPTFRGIKFSHTDLAEANQCLIYGNYKYNILFGVDQQLLAAMSLGIDAAIGSTYNYLAPTFNAMIKAFDTLKMDDARAHQVKVQNVINTAFAIGTPGVSAQKAVMHITTPIKVGPTRLPIPPASDDVMKRLELAINKLILT